MFVRIWNNTDQVTFHYPFKTFGDKPSSVGKKPTFSEVQMNSERVYQNDTR